MNKSNVKKKNNWEEKCEYLNSKERKERYINYILAILLIIFLIISFIYVKANKTKKNDEIAYIDTSNNKKNNSDGIIRFIYDGFNHEYPPNKKNYVIDFVSCNNEKGSWDDKKWQLNISGIVDKVSCSLKFKKKEKSTITTNNKSTKLNRKQNTIKKNNVISKGVSINKYLDNQIKNGIQKENTEIYKENDNLNDKKQEKINEEQKKSILLDLDECDNIEECNYKIAVDSNKEIVLKPIIQLNDENNHELEYELIKGSDAISVYTNGIIYAKDVADKEAYLKISIKDKPQIYIIIKIIVEAKLINTKVYRINRHNSAIEKILVNTNIRTFISNLMNKSEYFYIYENKNKISDSDKLVSTGMKLKLIINHIIYDQLILVVVGDIDGDGKCTSSDYEILSNHLFKNEELWDLNYLAADVNNDRVVNNKDLELIDKFIKNEITYFPIY